MKYHRGEIYCADLGPAIGHEQSGTRPVVVVQNDIGNHFSGTVIVCPLTSQEKKKQPTHALVSCERPSLVLAEQIRTISKSRISDFIRRLSASEMKRVDEALRASVGLMNKEGSKTEELIKVEYSSDRPTVSARELHGFLNVDTRFNVWFPRMAAYGFTEGSDFARVTQKCDTLGGMQDVVDYQLTLDMAKELCMIQRNERGKQARQYFLAVEKQWNDPTMIMARALKMADAKVKRLEAQHEADAPKVLFAESVAGSKTSILIRDLAKMMRQNDIVIGEKRLFQWLREHGYLIRYAGRDYNSPTQYSMERGLMEVKETTISRTNGTQTRITPLVTGRGQQYFINKFLKGGKEIA